MQYILGNVEKMEKAYLRDGGGTPTIVFWFCFVLF